MDIVREIDIFIKKHVTTSESFSPLYLAAWCLASWLPVPHIPPLFIRGSGTLKLVTVLTYLSGEIVVRDKFKGLTVTPTLLMEEPDWTGGCFLIGAEETGIEPAFDKGLRLRIGTWVRENGPVVQDVYWQLLNGAPPDALAPMTAVLLVASPALPPLSHATTACSTGLSSQVHSNIHRDLQLVQEIAFHAREMELDHEDE